jgi:hypothetical protein
VSVQVAPKRGEMVRLPVLPALNEIKITLIRLLFLIWFKLTSRFSLVILPSSWEQMLVSDVIYTRGGNSHRTNVIPASLRNGWMRSSIVVNWEKTIVFSPVGSPSSSSRRLISLSNSSNLRILAESGGKFASLFGGRDLRRAFRAISMQSSQCSPSLAMFSVVNL